MNTRKTLLLAGVVAFVVAVAATYILLRLAHLL